MIEEIRFQVGEAWKGTYDSTEEYSLAAVVQDPTGLSVYRSLKSGNVGHGLTDTSWWFCIIDLGGIKQESDRVAAVNDAMVRNEESRASAERERAAAERLRKSDEQTRQHNEELRAGAERERAGTEDTRDADERQRIVNETSRENAEALRARAEQLRKGSEQARESAETGRQTSENNRAAAERKRVSEETGRRDAETAREDAEHTRQTNEQARDADEQTRQTQEGERQRNEQARERAEGQRQSDYAAAEETRNGRYTAAEQQRGDAYTEAEAERQTQYSQAESRRDSSYTEAEQARDDRYSAEEGSRTESTAGDDSRWGEFRQAEKMRDLLVDVVLGTCQWAGCRWRKDSSTPEGEPCGSLAKIERLPELLGLGCYLVQNDHTRRKLSPEDHNFFVGGEPASLLGDMGHYQWGWNTTIYYAHWEDDTYEYEAIDIKPIPGKQNYIIPVGSRSAAGYAAMDRTTGTLVSFINRDPQFRGGNNNANLDELFNSQLGMPATNIAGATFASAARKNGNMWLATDRVMLFITAAIKRIVFHNRNIQAAFNAELTAEGLRQGGTGTGAGLPSSWSGAWAYYPYIPLSAGVELGDFTGVFSADIDDNGTPKTIGGIPSFFGLKNDYKYLTVMCCNMLLSNNAEKGQDVYIVDQIDGSTFSLTTVSGKRLVGSTPPKASAGWSYISKENLDNLVMFPTECSGASASTKYADGYYNPVGTSGLRGAFCLGYADYGDSAGSAYLAGDPDPSYASAYRAACLCEYVKPFSTRPTFFT